MSSDAWETYSVPGSPYFVLVDGASGSVRGEGTGATWPQVFSLITQATNDAAIALGDDLATDLRIDQELLAHGIRPGGRELVSGGRRGERERPSVIVPVVVIGVLLAVFAALRSTWSP